MEPTKESAFSLIPNFFKTIVSSLVPVYSVKAEEPAEEEEELVDPQTAIKEKCSENAKIESLFNKLQECNERVRGRSKTTETCVEELFDYVHELDHCVAHHNLWAKLK